MEMRKEFKNCYFDLDTKELVIDKGSVGKYIYTEIKKCDILNEDAKYTGKTEPFLHQVLANSLQPVAMHTSNVLVGIKIVLNSSEKLYIYVSDKPTQPNSLQFYDDRRNAEEIKAIIDKIISKYNK